ncbi:MAG: ATP-binding protein [Elusimicrobiota bacterium]|nr:ATP-binding protein [Elusimicrobiota bacterium]
MIISIASGKGGTGKTTIATNLALSLSSGIQFLDCDVEEPDAHIFLKPKIESRKTVSILVPQVDEAKCNFCGKCAQVCAYNAIAVVNPVRRSKNEIGVGKKNSSTTETKPHKELKSKVLIFPELCHGCGGCKLLCPEKAISEVDKDIGVIEFGESKAIQFVHGKLNIGEVLSPALIRAVKEYINPTRTVIIDVPPGTSCPVIEAVKGSDYCILVTEPTPFGLNDLILAIEVLKKLEIPFGVVINRADIGDEKVEQYCQNYKIPVLMRIPFDKEIAIAYSMGIPIVEAKSKYIQEFGRLFEKIVDR